MEPEDSLLCAQEPVTETYLEPAESSPHPPAYIICLKLRPIVTSHNMPDFTVKLLDTWPTSKLQDHPLSTNNNYSNYDLL
jgi:hypothetical protein